jgi:hypothetical protein
VQTGGLASCVALDPDDHGTLAMSWLIAVTAGAGQEATVQCTVAEPIISVDPVERPIIDIFSTAIALGSITTQ